MSINAVIDGTTYEGVETILVGGKTIVLSEASDTDSYPAINYYIGANPIVSNGNVQADGYNKNRGFAYITRQVNGAVKMIAIGGYTYPDFPTNGYPLYIPNGATKISVTCPNLMCAVAVHKAVNNSATAIDNGSWSSVGGVTDYDLSSFISSGATHVTVSFKNSSNTDISDTVLNSTNVQIAFS